jgi:hypothetical protein
MLNPPVIWRPPPRILGKLLRPAKIEHHTQLECLNLAVPIGYCVNAARHALVSSHGGGHFLSTCCGNLLIKVLADSYRGGDVQLGSDGCFSYRHLRSAGTGPIQYDPSFFISKEKVQKVGQKIDKARKKKPRAYTPPIPDDAVDACEASWTAAHESKLKSDPKRHDSHGVFVMTCRHSQPIFLCDIDTPGEQQKYIIAVLEEVASMLPEDATITQCYDVGCVTDRSINLVGISIHSSKYSILYNVVSTSERRPPGTYLFCHQRNARIWPPMGLPACLQPPYAQGDGNNRC